MSIPVIGNGDVFNGKDGVRMMEETGCDFVMVARGAMGNPWIFRELNAALRGDEIPANPTISEISNMMIRHLDALVELKNEYSAVREMRKSKTIAELLAKAHEKLDDSPRNNCTIELGRLVMALVALDSKAAEALNTPSVRKELERNIGFSRHPILRSSRLMAECALRYLEENKPKSSAENNTDAVDRKSVV